MKEGGRILSYIICVTQLDTLLESTGLSSDSSELGMAVLNRLSSCFDYIIPALVAIGDEELSLEPIKSCLLQEEQRIIIRKTEMNTDSALFHPKQGDCSG